MDVVTNNKRYKPKKASIKRIVISLILIFAVFVGIYALVTNDKTANDDNQSIHDVQKADKDNTSDKDKTKDENKDQTEQSTSGTVSADDITDKGNSEEGASSTVTTDSDEIGPTTTESSPETTNEAETNVVMPKEDKETIVANAITKTYTIYATGEQGSGFLINTKGDIVTNAHVTELTGTGNTADVVVENSQGQEFNGRVIGIDDTTDVSVIRVPDLAGKNPMVIDTAQAVVGTEVVAIGSPNMHSNTTTTGKITSVGANFTDGYAYRNLYEITAKLEAGSSGGPLINKATGNVIGINSIILTDHPEIGYSIPMANVMDLVNKWTAYSDEIVFGQHDPEDEVTPEGSIALDEENGFSVLESYVDSLYLYINQEIAYPGQRTYLSIMQIDSAGDQKAIDTFGEYSTEDKSNQKLTYKMIGKPKSDGDKVYVTVESVLNYTKDGKKQTLTQNITYEWVFEYDQYYVSDIIVNSSTDTADKVIEPSGESTEDPNTAEPEEDQPQTPSTDEPTEEEEPITPSGVEDESTDTEEGDSEASNGEQDTEQQPATDDAETDAETSDTAQ